MPPDAPIDIFCLHYLGGSGREYAALATALGSGYRLLPLDLAGFGDSRTHLGFTVTEMAQSVAARIRAHATPRCWLIGHSMGAKVAAVVARQAEDGEAGLEVLAGLIMLAGSPPAPEPMNDDKRCTMLEWFRTDEATARAEAALYISQNISQPLATKVTQQAVDDLLRMNRQAWRSWLSVGSREDWADRVDVLEMPALLIAGEDDESLGADAQRNFMLPHFRQGRLHIVSGATHLLPLEKPADISRLIDAHADATR